MVGFLAMDLWVLLIWGFFFFFLGKFVIFFFFFLQFFILTEVICTKSQEIVDGHIVLLGIMGWVNIYLFRLSFTCWFFYLMVWVRMEKKMKNLVCS